MEELLQEKMRALVEELQNSPNGIVVAVDFDHFNPAALILEDPHGANWNPYVHKHAAANGFRIIHVNGRNTYELL